ncbi:MAG: sugar phosphate isomerase/epimerase family protein [Bosea sp. (in: a-proteobacteria)]|uniref:sugar phosphate isomerase/epimerase family protein n=1 Tax=Bosea sp. (in: a-proteobacteria) TaxID=1871050 RepID=UPI003F7BDF10
MATTMQGPAIFLAQFARDEAPFDSWSAITRWAASLGYRGVQLPSGDARLFDLEKAADSQDYCDEIAGVARENGIAITELSTHIQGQLVAVHPAYDAAFDVFAPEALRGNPAARQKWAVEEMKLAAKASRRLGLSGSVSFTGALAWPFLYPWPQRPQGLVDEAFGELAKRWRPILDVYEEYGVDVGFEIHPGEDVFDGATFELFLDRLGGHPRCRINYDPSHFLLQQLDYLSFIDIYHERISAFHVKDAEFRPTGRQGVYSGFSSWVDRAGRFRSLGDGQVDFKAIFSKLAQHDYDGWAVLEWECALKHPEDGAREGARFIADHIIRVTETAFDDFAGGGDAGLARRMLGLDRNLAEATLRRPR